MPFIRITRSTLLSGQPAAPGDVFEVDADVARLAVTSNKAVLCEAPKDAVIEPPKPKIKKVPSTKED